MTDTSGRTRRPRWLTVFGLVTLAVVGVGLYAALIVSPPDVNQGDLIRVMYAHVPVAWIGFAAVAVSAFWGMLYLWRGRAVDDVRAQGTAEAALLYSVLTVVGGMTYSKPTLNTYWTWDAKLTLTALMVALVVGYFIVRALIEDPQRRARVSAVIMLVVLVSLPFNYLAAEWFRTLHPAKSINLDGSGVTMDPAMVRVLLINVLGGAMVFVYFISERIRIGRLALADDKTFDSVKGVAREVVSVR
ncbi:MAG: cytochrome c biogenesis protein CcsA [Trueperaceae bacterium]|nr:cytochrome c biogenesis protein CcsA [Trueperaceae bacterium]MCC6309947.1 cytochrome c biogenesis protein CcsA [Trueperaceae bacterium]MCO5173695.1 cytochrome c biogenesis protein [Trueperaceae bacterium]MCW5819182.1 cytochrome c biogenesis protein CcsA [Trueperaceae bacterium]